MKANSGSQKRISIQLLKSKVEVKAFIASLMILNEEEREFVAKFRSKIYEPNLLFEDKEIIERIINHPMAIWKCTTQ